MKISYHMIIGEYEEIMSMEFDSFSKSDLEMVEKSVSDFYGCHKDRKDVPQEESKNGQL